MIHSIRIKTAINNKKIEHSSHYHKTNGEYSVHLNTKIRYQIFECERKNLFHTFNDISKADKHTYQCDRECVSCSVLSIQTEIGDAWSCYFFLSFAYKQF